MMTTPTPPSFDKPRSPSPARAGQLAEYLDRRESNLVHPRLVEDELLRSDWHPIEAANAAAQYRRRFNEHNLGYSALLLTTGLAALAAGTCGHLLTASLDRPLDRDVLAAWLSVLFCSIPYCPIASARSSTLLPAATRIVRSALSCSSRRRRWRTMFATSCANSI